MNIKQSVAIALVSISGLATAAPTVLPPVLSSGSSFTDLAVGMITVSTLSNVTGSFFALDTLSGSVPFPFTFTLQAVTFSTTSGISSLTDLNATGAGFSFANVAPATYTLKASGTLSGAATFPGQAYIGASYEVTPVPEPSTYAMMLAGIGAVGFLAFRRRAQG